MPYGQEIVSAVSRELTQAYGSKTRAVHLLTFIPPLPSWRRNGGWLLRRQSAGIRAVSRCCKPAQSDIAAVCAINRQPIPIRILQRPLAGWHARPFTPSNYPVASQTWCARKSKKRFCGLSVRAHGFKTLKRGFVETNCRQLIYLSGLRPHTQPEFYVEMCRTSNAGARAYRQLEQKIMEDLLYEGMAISAKKPRSGLVRDRIFIRLASKTRSAPTWRGSPRNPMLARFGQAARTASNTGVTWVNILADAEPFCGKWGWLWPFGIDKARLDIPVQTIFISTCCFYHHPVAATGMVEQVRNGCSPVLLAAGANG